MQELLSAAALQALDPAEVERVLTHLGSCEACAEEYRKYEDAAADLSLQLPQRRLDPVQAGAMRARLMVRARADRLGGQDPLKAPGKLRSRPALEVFRWSGWMVAAGLSGVLLVHHSIHRPFDYGWLAAGVLLAVVFGLGVYARAQRKRVSLLQDRLTDRTTTRPDADRPQARTRR
jgi:anti-sigma factor RsiW